MKYNVALQALEFRREQKFALTGNEPYLKDRFIVIAGKTYGITPSEFWPDGEEDAIASLTGFFGDGSPIILYDAEKMNLTRLSEAIQNSDRVIIVVLSEDANVKTRTISSFLSKMIPVDCRGFKGYGNECPAWISAKISSAGYTADEGVVHAVFSKVGVDMLTLDSELQKLFIYKESTKHIELSDVDKVISATSVKTAYDILDGLIRGDVASAVSSLKSYSSGNFVEIVAFLYTHMEKMYRMILLRNRKHSVDAIADILGIPKFLVATKYLPKAVNMGKAFIIQHMGKLCDLDIDVRSFKGDKSALVERFFYGFAPK